jgi:hypothetical protein
MNEDAQDVVAGGTVSDKPLVSHYTEATLALSAAAHARSDDAALERARYWATIALVHAVLSLSQGQLNRTIQDIRDQGLL